MKRSVASAKLTKAVWRNAFLFASPEVLRALVNYRSHGVQGIAGASRNRRNVLALRDVTQLISVGTMM